MITGAPVAPIDLPGKMFYDSYSRLVEYVHGVDVEEKTKKLYYDPLGRVFRREILNFEQEIEDVTHYYYKGSELVQEFDEMLVEGQMKYPKDDILWDYLSANSGKVLRRRYVNDVEEQDYADYFHWNDAQGTAKSELLVERGASASECGYVVSADGEPIQGIAQPSPDEPSHIQFQGGFLEDKELTVPESGRGNLYRMGVRHYSPAYGRFLQRDPLSYQSAPNPTFPLAHNPYIYANNQAQQYDDTSGYAACCGKGGGGIQMGGMTSIGQSDELAWNVMPGKPCIVPWPPYSGCWCPIGMCHCCIDKYHIRCDYCQKGICVGFWPPTNWTRCDCVRYCESPLDYEEPVRPYSNLYSSTVYCGPSIGLLLRAV